MITIENWNYAYRQAPQRKAVMALEGRPLGADVHFYYRVLTTDLEDVELFGQSFSSLEEGIHFMNTNYADWTFVDPTLVQAQSGDSGCSTCAAH